MPTSAPLFPKTLDSSLSQRIPHWSADEIDRLCEMLSSGQSIRAIARAMKKPQSAVRAKALALDRLELSHTRSGS